MTHEITTEIGVNVQTVIWDLDGTILDSFGIFEECLNKSLLANGRSPAPLEVLQQNHHGTMRDSIAGILRDTDQNVSEEDMQAIARDFYVHDNAYVKDVDHHLFEDAVDLAERCAAAGKRQIIVTNRDHGTDRQNGSPRTMIGNSRLSGFMSAILCGDDSEYRKPLKRVLEASFNDDLRQLGETIVIGDQFVDAEFARNIGSRAILIRRHDQIMHLDRLVNYDEYVGIVSSLNEVRVA